MGLHPSNSNRKKTFVQQDCLISTLENDRGGTYHITPQHSWSWIRKIYLKKVKFLF